MATSDRQMERSPMPAWTMLDLLALTAITLLALLALPLAADIATWLIGAGLFGGSYLLAAGASVAAERWRGGGDRPPESGVR